MLASASSLRFQQLYFSIIIFIFCRESNHKTFPGDVSDFFVCWGCGTAVLSARSLLSFLKHGSKANYTLL